MTEEFKLVPKRRFKEFQNAQDWEKRVFSEIFTTLQNSALSRAELSLEQGIAMNVHYGDVLIKFGELLDISKEKLPFILDDTFLSKYKASFLNNGDIVIADAAEDKTVGKCSEIVGLTTQTIISGLHTIPCRPTQVFASGYLGYYMNSNAYHDQLLPLIQGTKVSSISKSALKNTVIIYPKSNEEQTSIAKYFTNLDNLITLHQRKLEKIKALKTAYLSELFPTEGKCEPKRRFAGFTGAWKQGTIGEFGYFYYGKSAPKWSVTSDATTPCVRYGELYTKHKEKIDTIYTFTNIPRENLKFSTGNEVLVPRVGEDPLDFANCSWLSIPGVAIGEMISVYNTEQNPLFTAYMFNALLKYEFAKRVEGGNVSNLYYTKLENIPVYYPSIEEQNKIASFLDDLSNLIVLQQRKLEKLQNLKKAYLNEMFI